jgi:ELWxxDGT repeat protein
VLLKDIREGTGSSYPSNLIPYFGYLYFRADSDDNGATLWRTDGTSGGTEEYVVVNPVGYNFLYSPFDFNDHLLWVAGSELYGAEVMYLDNYSIGEEDTTPPTVESVTPVNGASGVSVDASITVTFSESMNTSSVIISASPCDEECPTPSVTSWSEDGTMATIENGSDYDFGTEYTLSILGEDENGNDMT